MPYVMSGWYISKICVTPLLKKGVYMVRKPKPGSVRFQAAIMKVDNFGVLQKESSGSAMASKPGVVTRAADGATGSGTAAGGSAPTGTTGKVTAKAKTEVAPVAKSGSGLQAVCA